jgi:hypothetical protein
LSELGDKVKITENRISRGNGDEDSTGQYHRLPFQTQYMRRLYTRWLRLN